MQLAIPQHWRLRPLLMGHLMKTPGGHLAKTSGGHLARCGCVCDVEYEAHWYLSGDPSWSTSSDTVCPFFTWGPYTQTHTGWENFDATMQVCSEASGNSCQPTCEPASVFLGYYSVRHQQTFWLNSSPGTVQVVDCTRNFELWLHFTGTSSPSWFPYIEVKFTGSTSAGDRTTWAEDVPDCSYSDSCDALVGGNSINKFNSGCIEDTSTVSYTPTANLSMEWSVVTP